MLKSHRAPHCLLISENELLIDFDARQLLVAAAAEAEVVCQPGGLLEVEPGLPVDLEAHLEGAPADSREREGLARDRDFPFFEGRVEVEDHFVDELRGLKVRGRWLDGHDPVMSVFLALGVWLWLDHFV